MADPMTKEEATEFFSYLYNGEHHFPGQLKECGFGWSISHYGDLSTFDFNTMTRLVFLAHDFCYRAEVSSSNPGRVRIAIWKREGREGSMTKRHPSIEQALADWRKYYPIDWAFPKHKDEGGKPL
jgi:hypothetical protein